MPAPLTSIPRTSYDARVALGLRRSLTLSRSDVLRAGGGGIDLRYRGRKLISYMPSGNVTVRPDDPYSLSEFRRIITVLPRDWAGEWRPGRTPRLVFRDHYSMTWCSLTFHSIGDIEFVHTHARIPLAELHAEANAREGVTVLRSRRRTPRPLPSYVVRTDAVPEPTTEPMDNDQLFRWLAEPRPPVATPDPPTPEQVDAWVASFRATYEREARTRVREVLSTLPELVPLPVQTQPAVLHEHVLCEAPVCFEPNRMAHCTCRHNTSEVETCS